MLSRTVPRAAIRSSRRLQRLSNVPPQHARFQSTSPQQAAPSHSAHVAAGVAGGALVFLAGYAWYHISGTRTLVNTVHSTKSSFENAFKKSTQNAPQPNEALRYLKETVQSYARMVPGASGYVDAAFKDLDTIQEQHGEEVEKIIQEAYSELKDVTKAGATWEAAVKAGDVLQKTFEKLSGLAQDAASDIIKNHPELKEKFGGKFEQLKQMGDQFGPEAKKQVDETWKKVQDIVKSGPNKESLKKVEQLVQETVDKVKQYGDQAWQKRLEQAKPVLDKYPEVKEYVEKNKDQLLQGNIGQLWTKLKENPDEALKYAKEQVEGAKKKASSELGGGGGLAGLAGAFNKVPGSEEVTDQLKQLAELYKTRGKEAENLIKSTFEDVKGVLSKKVEEGQKLKDKAAKDVKN